MTETGKCFCTWAYPQERQKTNYGCNNKIICGTLNYVVFYKKIEVLIMS